MAPITIARFAGVITTALLAVSLRYSTDYYLLVSFAAAHYILAFIYALPVLPRDPDEPSFWLFIGLIVAAIITFFLPGDNVLRLLFFFCVHHILNEVYLSERYAPGQFSKPYERLIAVAFHGAVYFALLINIHELEFLDRRIVAAALAVASSAFVAVRLIPSGQSAVHKLGASAFELAALPLAIAALMGYARVRFIDVVFYHFILWAFIPLLSPAQGRGFSRLTYYLIQTAAITVTCVLLSPLGFHVIPDWLFTDGFYLFSYIHILTSFSLSKAQPPWLTRIFNWDVWWRMTR